MNSFSSFVTAEAWRRLEFC